MDQRVRISRFFVVVVGMLAIMFVGFSLNSGPAVTLAQGGPRKEKPNPNRDQLLQAVADIQADNALVRVNGKVRVVVELDADPTSLAYVRTNYGAAPQAMAQISTQAAQITAQQNNFAASLTTYGINAVVTNRLKVTANAVFLELDAKDIIKLASVPGIKSIAPVTRVNRDLLYSIPNIGVPTIWNYGLTGIGMRVAIIDDGINYKHADFGGTASTVFTPGVGAGPVAAGSAVKVVGGYDLVGDQYDARIETGTGSTPVPDGDPFTCPLTSPPTPIYNVSDTPIHHGTHVAGIAVGYGENTDNSTYTGTWNASTLSGTFKIGPGVAPNAKMLSYRVFGCYGSTSSEIIAMAIDMSVDPNGDLNPSDHVDVVNMSLGSDYGDGGGAYQSSIENATLANVVIVASAGNAADSYYDLGDPSAINSAISVAGTAAYVSKLAVSAPGPAVGNYLGTGAAFGPPLTLGGVTASIVISAPTNGCSALTNGAAIIGNIALVDRGTCTFKTKVLNAQNAGAVAAVICNNSAAEPIPMGDDSTITTSITIPSMMLSQANCNVLKANSTGLTGTVGLASGATAVYGSTSRGPRRTNGSGRVILKPDLAAPGSSITSAYGGSYTDSINYSGTSMAAPHVAGLAALIKAQNPTWTAREIKALLMNTSIDDVPRLGVAGVYGPGRVGTGKVNAPNAANLPAGPAVIAYDKDSPELVSVSFGVLNPVGSQQYSRTIELKNKGATEVTYNVAVNAVVSQPGTSVAVDKSSVTIAAGGKAEVVVTITTNPNGAASPLGHDASVDESQGGLQREWLSEVTGQVVFTASGQPTLRVAYHAIPRPTANMHASTSNILASGSTTQIPLSGTGVSTGSSAKYDVNSYVSPFTLQYDGTLNTTASADTSYEQLKYVGITSDYSANSNDPAQSEIYFAVVMQGEFSTPKQVYVQINVYTDPAHAQPDFYIDTPRVTSSSVNIDVFFSRLLNSVGTSLGFYDFLDPVYGAAVFPLNTYRYNSDVMVIPMGAKASYLNLASGAGIDYEVQTYDYDTGLLVSTTPRLSYNPSTTALKFNDVGGQLGGPYPYLPWYDDQNGAFVPVDVNFSSVSSAQALLIHYHNATGTRAEVVNISLPPTATPTPSATPIPPRPDTIGAFNNGMWYLRNTNTTGPADITTAFGLGTDLPVVGDWNNDGVDTLGIYRNGQFQLSDSNTAPTAAYVFTFGNPGDQPIAGKWDNTMSASGVGVYRSNGILYLKKALSTGFSDYFMIFGNPGDQPIAGDWDGNGYDSVGTYRTSNQTWYLSNTNGNGITYADVTFTLDISSNRPVAGDWDGNTSSTPGFLTALGVFSLHPSNSASGSDTVFAFGPPGSKPVAGKWVAGSSPSRITSVIGGKPGQPGATLTPIIPAGFE